MGGKRAVRFRDLQRLYDEHATAMFRLGMVMLRDEAAVKDLLQDLFAKLADGRAGWRDESTERAYLMQMVRRAAIDTTRREKVRRDHAETGVAEVFERCEDPDREAFRRQLEKAVAELPPEQREVVVLKLWEEHTFGEIATICGIPANTAASRYRYGIDKLRALLRPVYEEL